MKCNENVILSHVNISKLKKMLSVYKKLHHHFITAFEEGLWIPDGRQKTIADSFPFANDEASGLLYLTEKQVKEKPEMDFSC